DLQVDAAAQRPEPRGVADEVRDGRGGDGEAHADAEAEERGKDGADAEAGHGRRRAGEERGDGDDEGELRQLSRVLSSGLGAFCSAAGRRTAQQARSSW